MGSRTFIGVRRINDDLAADARREGATGVAVPFVCECARDGCFFPVWLRVDDYPSVVAAGGRVLAPGHAATSAPLDGTHSAGGP